MYGGRPNASAVEFEQVLLHREDTQTSRRGCFLNSRN